MSKPKITKKAIIYNKKCKECDDDFRGGRTSQYCKKCGDVRLQKRINHYSNKIKRKNIKPKKYMMKEFEKFLKLTEDIKVNKTLKYSLEMVYQLVQLAAIKEL